MTLKFLKKLSDKEPGPRRLAITYATLTFISLLLLWQQAGQWVENRLKADAQAQMVIQLDSIGASLSLAINQRLATINGLTAFTLTHATVPETEFSMREFETFAAGLQSSVTGIRNIAVAPGGVMQYVYPFEANKSVLGYEPLKDPRPNVRDEVNRAIESRQIILSMPYELIQGGLGIIALQAVFYEDTYWGLTNIVADLPPLLEDAGLIPAPAGLEVAIIDQSGRVFFGEPDLLASDPVIFTIPLPEGNWQMAGAPNGGWKTIYAGELAFFQAMGLLIVALLAAVAYLTTNRRERLAALVQKRTGELAQSNNELQQELAERLKAEKAMQESEQRYRQLIETSPIGILVHTDGEIVFANQSAAALLQAVSSEDLIGTLMMDYVHSDFRKLVQTRVQNTLSQQPAPALVEKLIGVDGAVIEVEVRGISLVYQGKHSVLVFINDVTERLQAEAERERLLNQIQEQVKRVQQIMDSVPEGVLLLDADGQVVLTNPAAARLLRMLANAGAGDKLTYLGERPLSHFLSPPPEGNSHEVKANDRRFKIIAQATESGPMAKGWVLVIRDITKEREIQQHVQEQDRLAAVGQLAAGIAHDFNNILAVIVLYTQLTLQTIELPPQARERLEVIKQQSNRAAHLVQQILDFSRRSVLKREIIDLAPFLQELSKLLERTLPETIQVKMAIQPGVYQANLDPTRIQQAVMNLSINARDAMPGGGTLCIQLDHQQIEPDETPPLAEINPGLWIRLSVTDTWTGIPTQDLPHIFNPFFTTKEVGKGSGLGMAQVYGIVKQHEGHIHVDTQPGQGTTFTLYLPALPSPGLVSVKDGIVSVTEGIGQTVLIVEDELMTREALVESVKALNYQPLAAADGQEALALAEQHKEEIALILTDMVMPNMGGEALLQALMRKGIAIPVVLLSGYPLTEAGARLHAQAFADYLQKPVGLGQLAKVMTRVINKFAL